MQHSVEQVHISRGPDGRFDGAIRCGCGVGLEGKADNWGTLFTSLVAGHADHKEGKVFSAGRRNLGTMALHPSADPSP